MPDLQTRHTRAVSAISSDRFHKYLMTSAAVALISIVVPSFAAANEWTGAISNDFFEPGNWDDGAGPQGDSSSVNNGSAIGGNRERSRSLVRADNQRISKIDA
ncbi:hypothetical protein, partial [Brucella intermedia]|uniref:hypothetical protein n=1 Tax=Brucella intermedia TaxID=94625 RepID=UPI00124DC33D